MIDGVLARCCGHDGYVAHVEVVEVLQQDWPGYGWL